MDTQRAFRQGLLVERYTANAHLASLSEFLDEELSQRERGKRESLGASLRDLIAEHHGLKLWLGVDVQYPHMFEELIAVGYLTTHTPSCINTSRSSRCSTDFERRCSSAMRTSCGMPVSLYWTTTSRLSWMSLDMRQPKEAPSANCQSFSRSRSTLSTLETRTIAASYTAFSLHELSVAARATDWVSLTITS